MAQLKTSKITKKSWVQDANGKRLTPKFDTSGIPGRKVGDFVYMTTTSIGQIVFHRYRDIIVFMEYGTDNIIDNLYQINQNLYALFVKSQRLILSPSKILIYNSAGEFLGTLLSREPSAVLQEKLIVTKNNYVFYIDQQGNPEFCEDKVKVKKDGHEIYINKQGIVVE